MSGGLPTPGPWVWVIHDVSMASLWGPRGEGQNVLSVSPCKNCWKRHDQWKWGRCTTPSFADAALIAAAPAMLAKLEQLAGECTGCDGTGKLRGEHGFEEVCPDCEDITSVISAARGKA